MIVRSGLSRRIRINIVHGGKFGDADANTDCVIGSKPLVKQCCRRRFATALRKSQQSSVHLYPSKGFGLLQCSAAPITEID